MTNSPFLAALLLVVPLAATAQTKTTPASAPSKTSTATTAAAPGTQQVTEVTEDLDPATGKVIRRTTRTFTVPAGTASASATTPSTTTASANATASAATAELAPSAATDAQITAFLRKKTSVATLTAASLVDAYTRFIERVRADRHNWKSSDWTAAAAVLSSLNSRYDQLRANLSFDDKLSIRSQQAEFQTLRTARQLSDQVSDKL
ncbi:hypothetical protein IC235_01295 [Hymenobacter sp. BT664]|uniref:Uncharacterized protein n=1 Tax=Hymenobacter montanus TaxID=2771359 RepID=A0A927GHW9_9BACT|nr:hypothetical protein [Hymenobacter montanus]MBD2766524.1 hypothetical protein [Hymenobacter montanus]